MDRFGHPPVPGLFVGLCLGLAHVAAGEPVPDHLERQEVLSLLAEDPTESFDVRLEEFAVPRRRALGVDQALALEEPDLGDRDVGEFLPQQRQHVANGQIRAPGHSFPATR
jgi:hypothetical protein